MDSDSGSDSDSVGIHNASSIEGDFSEEEDVSSDEEDEEQRFMRCLQRIRDNNPSVKELDGPGRYTQNITNDQWEEIGRDVSNNSHLGKIYLHAQALNDDKMSFLFRGLTRSSSIQQFIIYNNELSAAGVRSMLPFLQNAKNLQVVRLSGNNIKSEGFNILLRALCDSPIECLDCESCDIDSVNIENDYFPKKLEDLNLCSNNINTDGCRQLSKLLQGRDSTLVYFYLMNNKIDDEGVAELVASLRNNTSLKELWLKDNESITKKGLVMLLKLVNDISSIKATLQSNHTLSGLNVASFNSLVLDPETGNYRLMSSYATPEGAIQGYIDDATRINKESENNLAAGREKIILTQLHSIRRSWFSELQGVNQSVYSEINPLHLPEVLSLVGRRHGQGDMYVALKASMAELLSTVNRKKYIQQQRDYHVAKAEQLNAELAAIEAAERDVDIGNERSDKKRRRA